MDVGSAEAKFGKRGAEDKEAISIQLDGKSAADAERAEAKERVLKEKEVLTESLREAANTW